MGRHPLVDIVQPVSDGLDGIPEAVRVIGGLPENRGPGEFAPIFATAVCILSSAPSMVSPAAWAIPSVVLHRPHQRLQANLVLLHHLRQLVTRDTSSFDSHDNGMFCSSLKTGPYRPCRYSPPSGMRCRCSQSRHRIRCRIRDHRHEPLQVTRIRRQRRVAIPNALSSAYGVPLNGFRDDLRHLVQYRTSSAQCAPRWCSGSSAGPSPSQSPCTARNP